VLGERDEGRGLTGEWGGSREGGDGQRSKELSSGRRRSTARSFGDSLRVECLVMSLGSTWNAWMSEHWPTTGRSACGRGAWRRRRPAAPARQRRARSYAVETGGEGSARIGTRRCCRWSGSAGGGRTAAGDELELARASMAMEVRWRFLGSLLDWRR
jgi:hypothetical protein